MGVLKRKRPRIAADVLLQDGVVPGREIMEHMQAKGYCIVDAGLDPTLITKALSEVDLMHNHESSAFIRPSPVIQAGLLGSEGSSLIAMLPDAPKQVLLDQEVAGLSSVDSSHEAPSAEGLAAPSALARLDGFLSEVVWPEDFAWGGEFDLVRRSQGLLHLSDNAVVDEPTMTDQQVVQWTQTFQQQRLVTCILLGPGSGTLELKPVKGVSTDPLEVVAEAGTLVLWLPKHYQLEVLVRGRSVALSSFFGLSSTSFPSRPAQLKVPAVQQLMEMQMQRLRELKALEEADGSAPIPEMWATRLKHEVFGGQAIAVRGIAGHFPWQWDAETWSNLMLFGPDFGQQVPMSRWQHDEFYDPDPDSWMSGKVSTNHGSFMEGIEYFDNITFNVTRMEASVMDPGQRHVLEVAFEALTTAGHTKASLLARACGVYVGLALPEWSFADKTAMNQSTFGATGGAQSITSNRISFALGMQGPSVTIDTEQASSLTAVYMASESVMQKGRAVVCEMSVACGVSLMLSPMWWLQACSKGWFSRIGRAFCFDECADGHIRADASAGIVVKPMQGDVHNIRTIDDDDPDTLWGMIAGAMLRNSGKTASLNMPDAAAEQEVLNDVLVAAALAPEDLDFVEAFAPAIALHDAIEACAISRACAPRRRKECILLAAGKAGCCHSLDCSGVQLFIKNLRSICQRAVHPQLHLAVLNPHVACQLSDDAHITSEALSYRMESTFFANKARGFGGVNVAVIGWNQAQRGP